MRGRIARTCFFGVLLARMQVGKGSPGLRAAEGELCRFDAAAPRAGEYLADGHFALAQRFAHAPRLRAALVGQIALRRAVLEPEAGRVAEARRGERVPDEKHVPAAAHRLPQRLIGLGRSQCDRQGEEQPPHRALRLQA
jgi:hypothetical protein